MSERKIYGFLKSFPSGINTDVDPLLLSENTLAYALNATVRGDFVSQRPCFRDIPMVDTTKPVPSPFTFPAGRFQGACYYRSTDGMIMAAVGGNLYRISITGEIAVVDQIPFSIDLRSLNYPNIAPYTVNIAITPFTQYTIKTTVGACNETGYYLGSSTGTPVPITAGTDVVIPNTNPYSFLTLVSGTSGAPVTATLISTDANSLTAEQNWLWQAEQFLIWNDGIHLPAFFDGSLMRRSTGSSLASISTTAADFKVPAVGQVINDGNSVTGVALTTDIATKYWGKSFLIDTSQFVLLGTFQNNVQPYSTITANVLQQGSATDTIKHSNSTGTLIQSKFFSDGKYCGAIVPSGVVQAGATVANWDALVHPSGSTGGTQSTMTIPTATNQVTKMYMNVGDTILVNGYACTVISWTYLGGYDTNPVNTITFIPQTTAATGKTLPGDVTVYGGRVCEGWDTIITTKCIHYFDLPNVYTSSTTAGVMNGGTDANSNTFTVQLGTSFLLPSGWYTFTTKGTNSATATFTGYGTQGSSTLTSCQIVSPTKSVSPVCGISTVASGTYPTSINQIVQASASSPSLVLGAAYDSVNPSVPNYSVSVLASGNSMSWNMTNSLPVGSIAYIDQSNGVRDIFIVTKTVSNAASSGIYGSFKNQTGTEGNIIAKGASITPIPELDVSTIGTYGKGRNWVALPDGVSFLGGDLVGGASGTNLAPTNYNFNDAVLKVSQNQFLAGGTTFKISSSGETIRAMKFIASLDASLGQGSLEVFTDNTVFACDAPSDVTTWSSMTSPILSESLIGSGAISQSAVVSTNGDLLFRLSDGGIQSLLVARLDFNKWGNTPIDKEVSRIIKNDDPSQLKFCSMVSFENRVLTTCKPNLNQNGVKVLSPRGTYWSSIVALNNDPISSLSTKSTSVWDSEWTGMNVLRFITGFFGGVKRCFAICATDDLQGIILKEILKDGDATLDNGADSVFWAFESPMVFQKDVSRTYKRLVNGEICIRGMSSDVGINVFYKVDQNDSWTKWYSTVVPYQESDSGFRPRIGLGSPSPQVFDKANNRPMREGYDFQVKMEITGCCKFINGKFMADEVPEPQFAKPT